MTSTRSMTTPGGPPADLIERHRAAQLLQLLCRRDVAAVLAAMPARPLVEVTADQVRQHSELSVKEFWPTVGRLLAAGVLQRSNGVTGSAEPGDCLTETEVNVRIATVHDDPAEIRRGLVDRGLLTRAPGSGLYRRPSGSAAGRGTSADRLQE